MKENGWPGDAEVIDRSCQEVRVEPDVEANFEHSKGYNLWGIGRDARNVDRPAVETEAGQFEIIEKSIMSYLMHRVGRAEADSGHVMLIIEGPSRRSAGQRFRIAGIVTGTCWNPMVCDITSVHFDLGTDSTAEILALPCTVQISTRACLVTSEFEAFVSLTLDEWIEIMVSEMSSVMLSRASYVPIFPDGSLMWSRIDAVEHAGVIWAPGTKTALSFATGKPGGNGLQRQRLLMKKLQTGDPFATPPAGGKLDRGRGGGGLRPRASRLGHGQVADRQRVLEIADALDADGRGSHDGGHAHRVVAAGEDGGDACDDDIRCEAVDMDVADEASSVQSVEEVEAFFEEGVPGGASDWKPGPDIEEEDFAEDPGPSTATVDVVVDLAAQVIRDLADPVVPGGNAENGNASPASGSGLQESPLEVAGAPPVGVPVEPWRLLGEVTKMGYVYDDEPRSVLRIQRGKPRFSVTVTCYKHRGCHLLLTEARAPSDDVLKQWLFEVPATPKEATVAENKTLSERHRAIARDRGWTAPAKPSK